MEEIDYHWNQLQARKNSRGYLPGYLLFHRSRLPVPCLPLAMLEKVS